MADMERKVWYYNEEMEDNPKGPLTRVELQKLFHENAITAQTYLWAGAFCDNWTPLQQLGDLLSFCRKPPPDAYHEKEGGKVWYYNEGETTNSRGPLSALELKQLFYETKITQETFLWASTLCDNWRPLRDLRHLLPFVPNEEPTAMARKRGKERPKWENKQTSSREFGYEDFTDGYESNKNKGESFMWVPHSKEGYVKGTLKRTERSGLRVFETEEGEVREREREYIFALLLSCTLRNKQKTVGKSPQGPSNL